MADEWVTVAKLCEELDMPHSTFYDVVRPTIPVLKVGRTVRIRRQDLDRWIEEHMTIGGVQGAANR